jgi:hypothetical protein
MVLTTYLQVPASPKLTLLRELPPAAFWVQNFAKIQENKIRRESVAILPFFWKKIDKFRK